jgi:hypothetical protein
MKKVTSYDIINLHCITELLSFQWGGMEIEYK